MRASIFTLLLGAIMSVMTVTGASATEVTRLPNGLTILIQKDERFPLVSTRLYVHAGSAYETKDEAGISHLLEHMVFKGTENRPKGGIARDVERAGGYLNAATSFDYTVYLTDMPAEHWKLGMDVLKDMAFHPTLDAAELESEKDVVIAELQRGEDSPDNRIFQSLQAATLKGTPYERPIIGYRETIKATTPDHMRAYIRKHYQPQSMLLVVVGNVDPAAVREEARRLFGTLTNDHEVQGINQLDLTRPENAHSPVVTVTRGPWNKVYLGVAMPAPGFNDGRSAQLDVLTHLLGGDRTSLFYRTYKYEKQLVDDISVASYGFERLGMIYITAELDADKLEPFWNELVQDLATMQQRTFTTAEIERAKLNIEDGMYRAKETLPGLASKQGYFQFFSGGEQGEANYLAAVRDVNPAQLTDAIRTWLKPERLTVSALLPDKADDKAVTAALGATLSTRWPASAAKVDKAADTTKGKTEIVDLGSGRKVVLIPDTTLPYTAADLVFTGGNSLLQPDMQGLAALTAATLTKGAAALTAPEVEAFQADRAAGLSASAGRQTFSLSLRHPTRFSADMFGLLRDVLTTPAFAEGEVAREKINQIASIRAREDQPLGLAFRHLAPFLFPGHSYGFYHQGKAEKVSTFTPAQVRAYWTEQSHQPWVLSVAGQFDKEAVLRFARSLPSPTSKAPKVSAPAWTKERIMDLHLPERNQAHLLLIFPTAPQASKDTPALELMQSILAGQSGLLFSDLRDKQGLGYTVTALNWQAEEAGFMAFYIGTEPGKLEQAEKGFQQVIANLKAELLSEADLTRGKNQMEGDYYREHQRLGSRSAEAAVLTILGRKLDYNRETVARARKVTAEDLRTLARTYLKPEAAYTVRVLP